MASLKSLLNCIGVDASGDVSVLGNFFGFIRNRVPADPDTSVTASVSMLQQMRGVQGKHVHLNIIRVGFDTLSSAVQALALEKIDYATYRTQNIYRQVNLGVGRVQHWVISAADSNGRDDLANEDEAEALRDEWSVPNNGIDVFVVRNISDEFVGISPIGGNCDKNEKDDGLIGGEINWDFERFSRTFAHEIGHFLGLSHNHGKKPDCPASTEGKNNLMAQSRCAISIRNSVNLTNSQGEDVRDHCSG
ncbi:MAG TPA: zinc-dependent metalloprotease family protein, partial [Stenomitos sp.]